MTLRTLIIRGLCHHWRGHLGVLLGAAVGSAALVGALVVGDSVRGSLRAQALQRLGWVDAAVAPVDRFFTETLAASISDPAGNDTGLVRTAAAVLRLPATAARQDGAARANRVQVFGVRSNFWPGQFVPEFSAMPRGSVLLNEALAAQLNARAGDGLVLRVHKPSALSRDVPITPQNDASIALRLTVHGVVTADEMGGFSLQSGQAPPLNAFVHLDDLDAPAGLDGRANLLLAAGAAGFRNTNDLIELERRLGARARLRDYALELRMVTNQAAELELRTDRIFMESRVSAAAAGLSESGLAAGVAGAGRTHLTYLVNQIRAGDRMVPYSMVTAGDEPLVPADLKDDEIQINEWLAGQLNVKAGDSIELAYYLPESGVNLVERTNRFRVRNVVGIDGVHADRGLMPEFPGLAKAESTHDWDAGFPLVHPIRDEDERYWKKYRGTPKAFVRLSAGRALWSNRFGDATAVRFPIRPAPPAVDIPAVEAALLKRLDPALFGFTVEPVRERALASSAQSQDFGGLFIGFSFFLILAALILMALLFQFGIEQRTAEVGTLLAIGFTPARVRQLLMGEGLALALAGGIAGMICGLGYARAMLEGLTTIWKDAIGASSLHFHVTSVTLLAGLAGSVMVCGLSIWLVLRKQARRPARELLAEGAGLEALDAGGAGRGRLAAAGALAGGLAGFGLIGWALATGRQGTPEIFFGAGSLLLAAGLAGVGLFLRRLDRSDRGERAAVQTLMSLGLRGATRRRKRSLATIALLACGSFLVVAVGANRLDADRDAARRSSGTGGFSLYGESALPVLRDLNSAAGREFYNLDERKVAGVSVVPFRVRDGDEASCLNLNRAQRPRLLGVNPESLAGRKAFTFARVLDGAVPGDDPWRLLNAGTLTPPLAADEIPAIGDAASIQWALGKKLGDTLDYVDERGRPFKIRLVGGVANSILQGSLVIDEAAFVKRFPGEGGHRMFLIDVPSNQPLTNIAAALSRALQDVGLELTPATRRLAAFNAVQNTYLNTFQVLGGLGLLVGSAGLGVVVLRNVLERRGELGLMLAVGFRRRRLHRLVLCEHGGLLAIGLGVGMVAALAAVLPVLLAPGAEIHSTALLATLLGVLGSGLIWTWLATRFALRGRLIDALRNE